MAFDLIFRGELTPGVSRERAAEQLGKLFKQPAEEVASRLFTGRAVRIKRVETEADAERYIAAFAKAGMKLEVRRSDAGAKPSESPSAGAKRSESPSAGSPRRFGLVAAVLFAVFVAAGAWYTLPVWRNGTTSIEQMNASRALATDDLVAIGHLDLERALDLQSRLFGAPDPEALMSDDDDSLWASLVNAGIDPGKQVDDMLAAFYSDGEESSWAVVVLGELDAKAMKRWIASRYEIKRVDGDTIYFSWLDEKTCEPMPLHAARIGRTSVLLASADQIESLSQRLEESAPELTELDEWLALTEKQVLTIGIFAPTSIGEAADGVAGMMLAAAGQAATPADSLYFGAAPNLMPPGVVLSGAIASEDQQFIDQTYEAASAWLTSAKASAADASPDLAEMYERISVVRANGTLSAGLRLDTDIDDELQRLLTGTFQRAFQIAPSPGEGAPLAETIDESPTRFANASADQLENYSDFGSGYFDPQWQQGPFALAVSTLQVNDLGQLQISLRGEGRGLPNLGERSRLVRMRITDVKDADDRTLLPAQECGPIRNREWSDTSHVSEGSQYLDGEMISFPTVALDRALSLADGVTPTDVSSISGEIEYQLPSRVRSIRVEAPLDGKSVDGTEVRVRFEPAADRTIKYKASGDTRRLLAIRGLNANGQVLESGGAMWGESWFGGGENASVDVQGKIAAVEVVLADDLQPLLFAFELPGALPPMNSGSPRKRPPALIAAPDELSRAMRLASPDVTFTYNEPIATTKVGPGLLAVDRMEVSPFMGLFAQLEVYVSLDMPLEGQLNGGSIVLDQAELADGAIVNLDLANSVSFTADGAYWLNGEYTLDPDKPWLKGQTTLQSSDFDGASPQTVHGRVIFRTARNTVTAELSAAPGSRYAADDVELVVSEWRENSIRLRFPIGAERILSIAALDVDGNPAGRADRIDGMGADSSAQIELSAIPDSLQILIAQNAVEHDHPFSVRLPQ